MRGVRILLVRHCDAGSRRKWEGEDRLRPLSEKGFDQARALVPLLAGFEPDQVLSSPFKRCRQTMHPLVSDLGLATGIRQALVPSSDLQAERLVRRLVASDIHGTTVICTHGEVIFELAGLLPIAGLPKGGVDFPRAKGSVWVLQVDGDDFVAVDYLTVSR
jgi:8-oxo-dGTP diphosphatase